MFILPSKWKVYGVFGGKLHVWIRKLKGNWNWETLRTYFK